MEGDPAHRRDDPHELRETGFNPPTRSPGRRYSWFLAFLSIAFGLAAAAATVLRSGVLSTPSADGTGSWPVSALAIAVIAGCWVAGLIHLLGFLLTAGSRSPRSGWPAWLAAFAAGPLLVAALFFGAEFARFPVSWMLVYPVAAGIVVVLLFARASIRLLAERLLVSFFLWLIIFIAPTFWRDPVSDRMSSFLFGLLKAAGLLT